MLLRMDEQIQRLEKRVAQQDERIAQLERRVGRSWRNSSQPPSSDPPSTPPKCGKDGSWAAPSMGGTVRASAQGASFTAK